MRYLGYVLWWAGLTLLGAIIGQSLREIVMNEASVGFCLFKAVATGALLDRLMRPRWLLPPPITVHGVVLLGVAVGVSLAQYPVALAALMGGLLTLGGSSLVGDDLQIRSGRSNPDTYPIPL